MSLTNGTLDTRLSQNLVKEFEIPANKEYDKLNPHKIGGGNAIWITHIPPNVKVWFSTNQNFDNAQRLDYMNRGMRYSEIGSEGISRIYDNFYIFTEGTDENDKIKICVSTYGSEVEPILSSNTNQIDQVDAVGKMGVVDLVKSIESIKQLYFKPPMFEIKIMGEIGGFSLAANTTSRFVMFPLGQDTKNNTLGFDNDKWYRLTIKGHFDISSGVPNIGNIGIYYLAHFLLLNVNNGATLTPITNKNIDNFFSINKSLWQNEKNDVFDFLGIKFREKGLSSGDFVRELEAAQSTINAFDDIILKGDFINSFDNFGVCWSFSTELASTTQNESHISLLCQFYELETL